MSISPRKSQSHASKIANTYKESVYKLLKWASSYCDQSRIGWCLFKSHSKAVAPLRGVPGGAIMPHLNDFVQRKNYVIYYIQYIDRDIALRFV